MASSPLHMAFQVTCSTQKPSIPGNFNDLRVSLISSITFKPLLRELQKLPLQIDVSKSIKSASLGLLDAFVDSTFEFIDQPLLPSQSNFAPIDALKEAVVVTSIEGKVPDDFTEGVYIRNGGVLTPFFYHMLDKYCDIIFTTH